MDKHPGHPAKRVVGCVVFTNYRGIAVFLRRGVVLCAVAAWAAVSAVPAPAAYIHPFVKTFGSFSLVQSVAVDSETGDVYVYDGEGRKLLKFNAAGEPANFTATGTNVIEGLDRHNIADGEIAVDNSSGPAKGDIYVATVHNTETHESEIAIYSSAGERLGGLNGDPSIFSQPCGVATDPSGNVYIGIWDRDINKYSPKGNPVTNDDFVSSINEQSYVCQVAADSLDDAYDAQLHLVPTPAPVSRYDASQFGSLAPVGSVVDQNGSSLAVDPLTDEVYVDERGRVAQFGAYGEPFEQPVSVFAAEGPGGVSESVGIAVSGYNHDVYLSNGGAIAVFGPLGLVPTVVTDAGPVGGSQGMMFSGTVDPEGLAVGECWVEYGPSGGYGQSQSCVESAGEIGSGSSAVAVHANVAGLVAGTFYHYRFVVTNIHGRGEGADQSFAFAGQPTVSKESFSNMEETEVGLRAQINPNFRSTTYHVEYGTSTAYGQSSPESQPIGSDSNAYPVLVHVAGLAPGTTYHFRFVAANSLGTVAGPDVKFTTFASTKSGGENPPPPPPSGECIAGECPNPPGTEPPPTTTIVVPSGSTGGAKIAQAPKTPPKPLTRAQKLARALKACRRKHGKARHRCEATARKRYPAHKTNHNPSPSTVANLWTSILTTPPEGCPLCWLRGQSPGQRACCF
jgi:hypothetical protein